jgi:hypothetical protein
MAVQLEAPGMGLSMLGMSDYFNPTPLRTSQPRPERESSSFLAAPVLHLAQGAVTRRFPARSTVGLFILAVLLGLISAAIAQSRLSTLRA